MSNFIDQAFSLFVSELKLRKGKLQKADFLRVGRKNFKGNLTQAAITMVREEAVWKQNIVNLYLQCRSFWSFFFLYIFPYLRGTSTCNVSVWYVKYNEIKQFCLWSLDPLRKLTIRLRARNFYRINLVVFYLKCCNLIHNAKHYLFHNRQ